MMQKLDASEFERWHASSAQTIRERHARKLSTAGILVASISSALLLCACSMVNITPLGSTHSGRRQYEVTCNALATDNGTCHERAIALCGGSYETQSLGSVGPELGAYNGKIFTPSVQRVLLIACNQ